MSWLLTLKFWWSLSTGMWVSIMKTIGLFNTSVFLVWWNQVVKWVINEAHVCVRTTQHSGMSVYRELVTGSRFLHTGPGLDLKKKAQRISSSWEHWEGTKSLLQTAAVAHLESQRMLGSPRPHKDEIYLNCLLHWAKDLMRPHPIGALSVHRHPPLWQAQSHEQVQTQLLPRAARKLFFFFNCVFFLLLHINYCQTKFHCSLLSND